MRRQSNMSGWTCKNTDKFYVNRGCQPLVIRNCRRKIGQIRRWFQKETWQSAENGTSGEKKRVKKLTKTESEKGNTCGKQRFLWQPIDIEKKPCYYLSTVRHTPIKTPLSPQNSSIEHFFPLPFLCVWTVVWRRWTPPFINKLSCCKQPPPDIFQPGRYRYHRNKGRSKGFPLEERP